MATQCIAFVDRIGSQRSQKSDRMADATLFGRRRNYAYIAEFFQLLFESRDSRCMNAVVICQEYLHRFHEPVVDIVFKSLESTRTINQLNFMPTSSTPPPGGGWGARIYGS